MSQAFTVLHCSIPNIDRLISHLLFMRDGKHAYFHDVFFGKQLTKDPQNECWLKVRLQPSTAVLSQPRSPRDTHLLHLSMKLTDDEQAQGHTLFRLITDQSAIKEEAAALLDLDPKVVFTKLRPFLTLFVHRVSIQLDDVEFWVDAARLSDVKETKSLHKLLTPGSMLPPAEAMLPPDQATPTSEHFWFVSIGCRFPSGKKGFQSLGEIAAAFRIPPEIIPPNLLPEYVEWVPSKAYLFQGLSKGQAKSLGVEYINHLHMRCFDPLDNTSHCILPRAPFSGGCLQNWITSWAKLLSHSDSAKVLEELREYLLSASFSPSGSPAVSPELLYSLPVTSFTSSPNPLFGGVLFSALHFWQGVRQLSWPDLYERKQQLHSAATEEDIKTSLANVTAYEATWLQYHCEAAPLFREIRKQCQNLWIAHASTASKLLQYSTDVQSALFLVPTARYERPMSDD